MTDNPCIACAHPAHMEDCACGCTLHFLAPMPFAISDIHDANAEHTKRLEEYAAENAALRDRIKGEHLAWPAKKEYEDRIAAVERERDEARDRADAIFALKAVGDEQWNKEYKRAEAADRRIAELESALRAMTHEGCRERKDGACVLGHEECEKANAALSSAVEHDDDTDCLVCHGTGNVFYDGRDLECPCVRHRGAPAQPATAAAANAENEQLRSALLVCETSCTAMKDAWNGALDQLREKWQEAKRERDDFEVALLKIADGSPHDYAYAAVNTAKNALPNAPAQPATAAAKCDHPWHRNGVLLTPCPSCNTGAAPPSTAARVCLGCGHFKHSNACNCGCTMSPVEEEAVISSNRNLGDHDFVTHVVPLMERVIQLSRDVRYWSDPNESACKEYDAALAALDAAREGK